MVRRRKEIIEKGVAEPEILRKLPEEKPQFLAPRRMPRSHEDQLAQKEVYARKGARKLCRALSEKAIYILRDIMLDEGEAAPSRIVAAKTVLEYGIGKPTPALPESIDTRQVFGLTDEQLEARVKELLGLDGKAKEAGAVEGGQGPPERSESTAGELREDSSGLSGGVSSEIPEAFDQRIHDASGKP